MCVRASWTSFWIGISGLYSSSLALLYSSIYLDHARSEDGAWAGTLHRKVEVVGGVCHRIHPCRVVLLEHVSTGSLRLVSHSTAATTHERV